MANVKYYDVILKPVITENREGKIVSTDKIRGRKKALNFIVEKAVENADPRCLL